ncbi:unnamed protein product, partial [Mesorhabditis belari]|uniref:Mariner Mos1 transposase n=1 Tax=Mesorhabditis belari TaxID=2138241 RepID=A0AAF3FE71_9BILA
MKAKTIGEQNACRQSYPSSPYHALPLRKGMVCRRVVSRSQRTGEAPTDYHVNRSLKNWQTNKIYNDLDDLIDDVNAWIASKDRLFFARGIDRLPSKWQSVIDVGGEYAPE